MLKHKDKVLTNDKTELGASNKHCEGTQSRSGTLWKFHESASPNTWIVRTGRGWKETEELIKNKVQEICKLSPLSPNQESRQTSLPPKQENGALLSAKLNVRFPDSLTSRRDEVRWLFTEVKRIKFESSFWNVTRYFNSDSRS